MNSKLQYLIDSKFINEKFLEDELIDGYWVPSVQKELWALNLYLLDQFDKVCIKYNISYFLAFGTLIGAVRHHGFIPWDDDVDVMITRDNYEKFLSIAKQEGIHLIIPYDKNTVPFAQVADNIKYNCYEPKIDIFPLDKWPSRNVETDRFPSNIKQLRDEFFATSKLYSEIRAQRKDPLQESIFIEQKDKLDQIYTQYNNDDTILTIGNCFTILRDDFCDRTFSENIIQNLTRVKFSILNLPIPMDYDIVLKTLYVKSNYKEFPPEKKRFTSHNPKIKNDQQRLNNKLCRH